MIPIEVRSKSSLIDGQVAEFAQHRIRFALDRLPRLRKLLISLEDVNGPKGGADKRCRVIAEFGYSSVLAEETKGTWQAAVACAIHRIGRNAARKLQRVNRASIYRGHRVP